jgi:hypothetical protein
MFTGNVDGKSGQLCTAVSRVFSHGQQLERSEASHHYQGAPLACYFLPFGLLEAGGG